MRLGLATKADLPDGAEDDRALLAPLAERGVQGAPRVWDDRSVRWEELDGTVVRSTWDYHLRREEFLSWAGRVEAACGVWNRPPILRWNSHKAYLSELEAGGVAVVPTRRCHGVDEALATARAERWSRFVVKPAVSAGGYRTYLVDVRSGVPPSSAWAAAPPEGEVLVQPYMEEVERSGERSLVFFTGEFSHAFLRAPHLAPHALLREGDPVAPSEEELRLGRKALEAAPGPTLYARVDLVRGPEGSPWLMELELIEPFLGLRSDPKAPARFAESVREVLHR